MTPFRVEQIHLFDTITLFKNTETPFSEKEQCKKKSASEKNLFIYLFCVNKKEQILSANMPSRRIGMQNFYFAVLETIDGRLK